MGFALLICGCLKKYTLYSNFMCIATVLSILIILIKPDCQSFFWGGGTPRDTWDLVYQPQVEPWSPAMEPCSLNLWIVKEVLIGGFFFLPGASDDKESACNAGDLGLIPRSGRSPGEGNGNPFQYSCPENSMDRGAWQATVRGVTKSWT